MIYRGEYQDAYLYQLTHQDLILKTEATREFREGDILVFGSRSDIRLGSQIARADDIEAAHEYLDNSKDIALEHSFELSKMAESLEDEVESLKSRLVEMEAELHDRDMLLNDVSVALKGQRSQNVSLSKQLSEARVRLGATNLAHQIAIDDLEQISDESKNIEQTLQETISAKEELEHELANAITNFIELNLQYDELEKKLSEVQPAPSGNALTPDLEDDTSDNSKALPESSEAIGASDCSRSCDSNALFDSGDSVAPLPQSNRYANGDQAQTITLGSGKNIHVYHEFPKPTKRSALAKTMAKTLSVFRLICIILLALFLIAFSSIIATAEVNHSTFGDALDVLLNSFGFA